MNNILQSVDEALSGEHRTYSQAALNADIRRLRQGRDVAQGILPKHGTVDAEMLERLKE